MNLQNHKSERGQALVVIVIALMLFIAILALVVDGGNAFLDRRNAQNSADSAALAAAVVRIRGEKDWVAAALTAAANNGYENDGVRSVVTVFSPPADGPYVGNVEYIQVVITSNVETFFARVVGVQRFTNTVTATSRSKPSEIREILQGMAIVSLAPTSNCLSQKAFWVHGDATLNITGGGVFVNSNNKDCAFIQQGNGGITIQGGQKISVVGGVSVQKPQLLSPGVAVGAIPSSYPPPFFMPNVDCGDEVAEVNEDGTTMSPGSWDEKFPPEGVTKLEPGEYCLKDGFEVNGNQTLEGHDVTIKVESGEVKLDGNATLILDAPDKGDNKGLLLYLPTENDSQVVLNGSAGSSFIGTILAPASEIVINGNSSSTGFQCQIVGYRVEATGSGQVIISYDDSENYDAVTMPEVQLSQ